MPPYYTANGARRSGSWEWLSRGKHTASLPLAEARALCEAADVVLIDAEAAQDVLGLAPADVRAWIEGVSICVLVTPFALDGPLANYRATDLGLHARGGWMSRIGYADREPLRPGGDIMPRVSGVWAFFTAITALRHLEQGGNPQYVELAGQAVGVSLIHASWLTRLMAGISMPRSKPKFPGAVLECADGYVGCSPLTTGHWELLCQMMGLQDVLEHPEGRDPAFRAQHGDELYERVRPWLMERTRAEIVDEAQAWGIPAAPVEYMDDRLECPQLNARGFWVQTDLDDGPVRVPRVPYLIEDEAPVARGPVVVLGGEPSPERPASSVTGTPPARPFEGIVVLDLTHFWAGPYATMLLGALGATVIKVESIQRPDGYRLSMAVANHDQWYEQGAIWIDTNHDKLDVTLDLSSEEGRELVRKLARQSDIVISNFANRVMPNMGLTPEALHELNDQLIVATLPGYGPGGPWENYVGYGFPFEQVTGCNAITGYEGELPLQMSGFVDPLAGVRAATALTLALRHRERTGHGTTVEIPQCEVVDALFAPEHIAVQRGAAPPSRMGNRHAWMAPHNAYRVQGDDEWLTVAVASDAEFTALVDSLGIAALATDPRFSTVEARKENEDALDAALAPAFADRDAKETEALLQGAGVAACIVRRASELNEDESLVASGFFQPMDRPLSEALPYKTWPFRFSSIESNHRLRAPLLGEHNEEILAGWLGLSADEIAALAEKRVVGDRPLFLG